LGEGALGDLAEVREGLLVELLNEGLAGHGGVLQHGAVVGLSGLRTGSGGSGLKLLLSFTCHFSPLNK